MEEKKELKQKLDEVTESLIRMARDRSAFMNCVDSTEAKTRVEIVTLCLAACIQAQSLKVMLEES